jgi:hypothetical protein
MVDQLEPKSSIDGDVPHFHWWPKKGTKERVELTFARPARIEAVEVYWFQDEGVGECRVPASWELFVKKGGQWERIERDTRLGCEKDRFNTASFAPVDAEGIRLEVQLQEKLSTGIHELRLR